MGNYLDTLTRDSFAEKKKPILLNKDGSFSTERTITVEADGKFYNLPTIVNGKPIPEKDAVKHAFDTGQFTGVFNNLKDAESSAIKRSGDIGDLRGKEAKALREKSSQNSSGILDSLTRESFSQGSKPSPASRPGISLGDFYDTIPGVPSRRTIHNVGATGVQALSEITPMLQPGLQAGGVASVQHEMAKKIAPQDQTVLEKTLTGLLPQKEVREKISGAIAPTEKEIIKKAGEKGEVPYGAILKKVGADIVSELIPMTPTQAGLYAGFPKMTGLLKEAFPLKVGDIFSEFVMKKSVKVKTPNQTLKDFYVFGKEKLSPKEFDLLQKVPKEKIVEAIKTGDDLITKSRVPRFGKGEPFSVDIQKAPAKKQPPLKVLESMTRESVSKSPVLKELPKTPDVITPPYVPEPLVQKAITLPAPKDLVPPPGPDIEEAFMGTDIEEPSTMTDALTRNTLSEYTVGDPVREGGVDIEKDIVDRAPQEIRQRANALRKVEQDTLQSLKDERDIVIDVAGKFSVKRSDQGISKDLKNVPSHFKGGEYQSIVPKDTEATFGDTSIQKVKRQGFDKFSQSLRNSRLVDENASGSDVIEYLQSLEGKKAQPLSYYESLAEREYLEELQGKTVERVQPGLSREVNKGLGITKAKEPKTVGAKEAYLEGLRRLDVADEAARKQKASILSKAEKQKTSILNRADRLKSIAVKKAERLQEIQTRRALNKRKRDIADIVKKKIPIAQRGEFLKTIANAGTKEKDIDFVTDKIDKVLSRIDKKEAITELRKAFAESKKRLSKLRPEYQEKVAAILNSVDTAKMSNRKIDDLESLRDYIEAEPLNAIPESRLKELSRLSRMPASEMSPDDVRLVTASVNHLIHLNNMKNTILAGNNIQEFAQGRDMAVENLKRTSKISTAEPPVYDFLTDEPGKANYIKNISVNSENPELQTEKLDGADKGIIQEIIYRGIDRGESNALRVSYGYEDFMRERLQGINLKHMSEFIDGTPKKVVRKEFLLDSGKRISLTGGQRISLSLHSRNDQNLAHIVEGGVSPAKNIAQRFGFTVDDVSRINGEIADGELAVANAMSEYLNTIQNVKMNEVSLRLNGFEIATVNQYFPIRTNALDRVIDELIKAGKNFTQITIEGMNMLKGRVDGKNTLILEDAFLAMAKSVQGAAAYVGYAEPMRAAKSLLEDPSFKTELFKSGRRAVYDDLHEYLQHIEGVVTDTSTAEILATKFINKMDTAVLGLDPFVILNQTPSFLLAASEMSMKYLVRLKNIKLSKSTFQEMARHPQLRSRLDGKITRELGEIAQAGQIRKMFTGKKTISQNMMKGVSWADSQVVGRIWEAVKLETQDLHPELTGDAYWDYVGDRAWEVIRRTQPTFHLKDRTRIGRSRSTFMRLATKYSSQRSKNLIMVKRANAKYQRSKKTLKDKSAFLGVVTLVGVVTSAMIAGVQEMRAKTYGYNKKDKGPLGYLADVFTVALGNVYFVGNIVSGVKRKIEYGSFGGSAYQDVLTYTLNQAIDVIANAVIMAMDVAGTQPISEKKFNTAMRRVIKGIWDLTGKATGIPLDELRRMATAGYRVTNKKPKPMR